MRRAGPARLAGVVIVVAPVAAGAQAVEVGVAAGVAVPAGAYAEARTPGPVVRGSLTMRAPERRIRFRTDLEGAWLVDRSGGGSHSSHRGTLRAVTVAGSALVGARGAGPYASAGLAVQRLAVAGARNPYGATLGLRGGAGARWRAWGRPVHAEATLHLALTDYATGRDFATGVYVPVMLGVGF